MTVFSTIIQGNTWATLARYQGETVTYKAAGAGAGISITVVWQQEDLGEDSYSDADISKQMATVIASPTDITTPLLTDTFVRGGVTYAVESFSKKEPLLEIKVIDIGTIRVDKGRSRRER